MTTRRAVGAAVWAVALTIVGGAQAGTPKEDAAALGDRGLSEYGAGKLVEALLLFQQAQSTAPSVTFQLYEARCLVRLGQVDEAARVYEQVARTPVDERASPVVLDAVATAELEREALRAGKALPSTRPAGASGAASPPPRPEVLDAVRSVRTAGWVGVGVGAVSVLTGIGYGLSAASQRKDLDERCRLACGPVPQGALEDLRAAKTTSTIALVVGGAFLGAGAGVLLLVPPPRAPRQAWIRPVVAPLAAGVVGSF